MAKRQDLFKFIRRTMYFAAMYSPHLEHPLRHELGNLGILLELIFEVFLYFVTIHIALLYILTIYLNFHKGDLELLVNCLMQTIIYIWTILMKLHFRRLQRTRLEDLINFMNSEYKQRSAIGFTYVTMDECYSMANKWIKLYVYCCFLCAICWLMVPIAYGDRSLPLDCWYPFDYKEPVVYEIIYFLQFVAQIQVAGAFSTSSGFHMVLSILISGQYDILACSLKNILATVAIKQKASKRDLRKLQQMQEFESSEINEYYCSKERTCHINTLVVANSAKENFNNFRHDFRNLFKDCIDHHKFIRKCLNKMEDFYSLIWFLKTGEVILLMCLVAFVSVKTTSADTSFMQILSLGQYLLMVALEFLVICYFGEIIYLNSQRCSQAILRSPWYMCMPELKNDFLIFLQNTKKPFQLTAGKINALNIECFKAIMKTAFSFLTFLQTMDERNV